MNPPAYDFGPVVAILALGALIALAPLAWVSMRDRDRARQGLRRGLTWATLFLTFDLVLFGAFTRLTDSGLGCPDWPGCYGNASPVGARSHIDAAQSALPSGPVTHGKAWIEMTHRYLATAVGALITLLAAMSWLAARRGRAETGRGWAMLTLLWVCLQGAFGALTVTMKLYPAIVTLHLLGGIGLLVLLAAQTQALEPKGLPISMALLAGVGVVGVLAVVQMALGGWVSTNYAVLACRDFPTCQGAWWPPADFGAGFHLRRELGVGPDGEFLPFAALTAIHLAHRIGAVGLLAGLALLVWRLARHPQSAVRRWAWPLAGVAAWQVATGLGNVVLGWPMISAVAHTGGAAALAVLLTVLGVRGWQGRRVGRLHRPAPVSARTAS